jgi:membrane associated rhomboid family serine protease
MQSFNRGGGILAGIPPVTKILLVTNLLVFLVDMVTGHQRVIGIMALASIHTGAFQPYQLITHMFAHGNFTHLFFNMFGVWMFGRAIEMRIGSKRYFTLYFLSGLGAAGLQLLIYYLHADIAGMVGASGALFGILAAFALYFPNIPLMLIFFPVPIKAKYFVAIYAAIELFSGITTIGGGSQIAHFAHLGGAIVGFILVKIWKKNQFNIM